jgi:hypothetical protein
MVPTLESLGIVYARNPVVVMGRYVVALCPKLLGVDSVLACPEV